MLNINQLRRLKIGTLLGSNTSVLNKHKIKIFSNRLCLIIIKVLWITDQRNGETFRLRKRNI